MTYLILLFACLLGVGVVQLRWVWKRRRRSASDWNDLLKRAEHVDLQKVQLVADCYLHPERNPFQREPGELWELLGGLEGINRLYRNAELMLELATFAEQWQHPEAALTAELVRRDGVRIKHLVTRMQFSLVMRKVHVSLAFDVQEAAATYFLMRGRLLGLYQVCHIARTPALAAAL